MKIKPSLNFEGSDSPMDRWMEYVRQRSWAVEDAQKSIQAVFFRAAEMGLEKRDAVTALGAYLSETTELDVNRASLTARANVPYRVIAEKKQEGPPPPMFPEV